MILNVSQLELYRRCPRKWAYQYPLGAGDPPPGPAQVLGLRWHALCAGEAEVASTDPLWMRIGVERSRVWRAEHPEFEVIANELTLEAPFFVDLDTHTLRGRLDCVVRWNGKYWHWQRKTLDAAKNPATYAMLLGRSWHEHVYKYLAERNGFLPYGGSWLEMARKLSDKRIVENGENPLIVEPLPTAHEHEAIMRDFFAWAREVVEWEARVRGGALPPQDTAQCGGVFGNSPCFYLDRCRT